MLSQSSIHKQKPGTSESGYKVKVKQIQNRKKQFNKNNIITSSWLFRMRNSQRTSMWSASTNIMHFIYFLFLIYKHILYAIELFRLVWI